MLYSTVHDPKTSTENLNDDLDVIRRWTYQWKKQFNPDPTKHNNNLMYKRRLTLPLFFAGCRKYF